MSERMTDDDVLHVALRLGMGKVTKEQVLAFADVITRASETAQAAEIERLKAELAVALKRLDHTCGAIQYAGPVEDLPQVANRLWHAHESARADIAHLTPSGQVAEDERRVAAMLALFCERREQERAAADDALSCLAAQAQGYEAAVADTAALLRRLNEGARLVALLPPHGHEGDEETGQHDEDCEQCRRDALEAVLTEDQSPHPGAALLKERQERDGVIKALGRALATEVARGDEDKGESGHVRSCPNMGAPGPECSPKCRATAALLAKAGTGL